MKKPTDRANRIIIAFLILQAIGGLFLMWFIYNFLTDPQSAFNESVARRIQNTAGQFKPLEGIRGEKGEPGEDGRPGRDGKDGDKGDTGSQGIAGNNGLNGDTGNEGPAGPTGPAGPQGVAGEQGPRAEFRCNPDNAQLQYKYPADEDWMDVGSRCVPTEGGSNDQITLR